MNLLGIDEVKEGMILERDIVNDLGIIYMTAGTVFNSANIEILKKVDIDFLYVKDPDEMMDFLVESEPTIEEAYSKLIIMYKSIYMNVRLGRELDMDHINLKVLPLLKKLSKENNIMNTLRKIDTEESYLYKHAVDVAVLSKLTAKWLNLTDEIQDEVGVCAFIHDIGKTQIDVEILNKPGNLNDEEYEIMKRHSSMGYEILINSKNVSKKILYGVLYHHERFDGSGYPDKIKGINIPLYARIIAVADIFDAVTSNKAYKNKISIYEATKILKEESFDKLDPRITEAFIYNLSRFYVGNKIKLNNGKIGQVVLLNKYDLNRPLIKVGAEYIDLATNYKLEIVEVLK